MSTSFPSGLDQYEPVPRNQAIAVKHHERHQNVEDAVEALEAKVGVDGSTVPTSLDYRVTQMEPVVNGLGLPTGSALVGWRQFGANALTRDVEAKLREVEISITDFADNEANLINGTEAADAAWTRAQTALALKTGNAGGTIKFPCGTFRFTSTMRIGTQSGTGISPLNGIRIVGEGTGQTATTMAEDKAATKLLWDGAVGGRLIDIAGPISGVSIENLMLDGNLKAANLVRTMRSFHQTMRDVIGVRWTNGFALEIGANVPPLVIQGGGAPISHLYDHVDFQDPGPGAHCVDIANGSGNVNQVLFHRCYLDRALNVNTIGVRLGYCDHIMFAFCHIAMTGGPGNTGVGILVRSQAGLTAFPWNCTFIGTTVNGGCSYDTTLATWNNASFSACIFYPFYTADGSPVPPKTANGGVDAPPFMFRGETDNGIRFGWGAIASAQQIAAAATISPTSTVIQVTGTGVISNITVPHPAFSVANGIFELTVIPTSGSPLSLATGGNIAENYSMTNLRAFKLVYSEGTGFWSRIGG